MPTPTTTTPARIGERDEILAIQAKHRGLFLVTVRGLSDEQARLTPTVSALSLGGLVKHVAATVDSWLDFVEHGARPRATARTGRTPTRPRWRRTRTGSG